MKFERAAKTLRKSGYNPSTVVPPEYPACSRFVRPQDRYAIDVSVDDEGNVTRLRVVNEGEQADSREDYFPGWDAPSLKRAIAYAEESNRHWRERHGQVIAA